MMALREKVLSYTVDNMYINTIIMEIRMENFQRKTLEIPFDLVIPYLGIFPKELTSSYYRNTCIPMFVVAQFIIAKSWNIQQSY